MRQNENRSELQKRLDTELRAKAAARRNAENDRPDGVEDSAYIKGTKQTTGLAWAWALIFFLVLIGFGYFIYMASVA